MSSSLSAARPGGSHVDEQSVEIATGGSPRAYAEVLSSWEAELGRLARREGAAQVRRGPPELLHYEDPRCFLEHWYRWRCLRERAMDKPRYSYRAFGREAGQGNELILYHLIRGHRNLTESLARAIVEPLGLGPRETQLLVTLARRSELERRLEQEARRLARLEARCVGSRGGARRKALCAADTKRERVEQLERALDETGRQLAALRAPEGEALARLEQVTVTVAVASLPRVVARLEALGRDLEAPGAGGDEIRLELRIHVLEERPQTDTCSA